MHDLAYLGTAMLILRSALETDEQYAANTRFIFILRKGCILIVHRSCRAVVPAFSVMD